MIVIKRYPNRKLYNTDSKKYVTLVQLAEVIRTGEEVQILDHTTGEDLSAVTLTQVIYEQEKKQAGFLPRSVLAGLVQSGGQTLTSLRRTLASPLDLVHHVDLEIEHRINSLVEAGKLSSDEGSRILSLLLVVGRGSDESIALSDAEIERILAERGVPSQDDIRGLNTRLEELVSKLNELNRDQKKTSAELASED
jgi:polyhydroxyalkanoate synthesis repressor PhaR